MARVVLAMSGGVDSSVAAHLLLQAGHEVIGVFMRHGQPMPDDGPACTTLSIVAGSANRKQGCCSAEDAADARRVADRLDIPFYALNLQADFGRIIDYFVADYLRGRTPNPCIVCNQWLKFGRLFDYADSVDAEFVATGHYARCIRQTDSTHWLCRGVDQDKDQSYVLFGIDPSRLGRMLLPVGAHQKPEIRAMAAELGLRVADKRDSQEICFVPPGEHGAFVKQHRGERNTSGRIVTTDGTTVGQHDGIEQFTIGQRKGLRVAMGEPYFVVRIDPVTCDVVIGRRPDLACRTLTADGTNWLVTPPADRFRCQAKIRYNTPPADAWARALENSRLEVEFDEPCFGVAPGQAVVCYAGDRVLGGGWIC
jgi:tRNA-specific 2-thiouridylase